MKLSKKALARINSYITSLGLVVDPQARDLHIPITDAEVLHQQETDKAVLEFLVRDFDRRMLALCFLGMADSSEITDIIAFDAAGKPVEHIGEIGSKNNDQVARHARNLLSIIKDRRWLVSIEKKIGHSLFDHEDDGEMTTTLVKRIDIRIKAKSKYEATYKALLKLIEQERPMTVNERSFKQYTNDEDVNILVASHAYNQQRIEWISKQDHYTVNSTIMID